MITGSVNGLREARVRLKVQGSSESEIEVNVIVDTGFTGFLTLPESSIEELGLEWLCGEPGILGDGSIRLFDVYVATILWDGQPVKVEVNASDTDPLAGMGLIHGHRLQINAVEGGSVTIEALPGS